MSCALLAGFTVALVPLATHVIAGPRLHKDAWRFNTLFSGPWRFQTFQAFAWAFFALGVVLALAQYKEKLFTSVVHTPALFGASVCSALISEVLVVSSLFSYHCGQGSTVAAQPASAAARRGHRRSPSLTRFASTTGVYVVTGLCCALALAGTALLLTAHHSHLHATPAARLIFATLALACFAIAVPVQYGVGGRLKWGALTWNFWQPGAGGLRFMLLQAFGWACFTLSVAGCAVVVAVALRTGSAALLGGGGGGIGDVVAVRVVAVASWIAGGAGFAAQIITACSLLHFQPIVAAPAVDAAAPTGRALAPAAAASEKGKGDVGGSSSSSSSSSSWVGFLECMLVMHVIHAPHLILLAIVATVLAVAPNLTWSFTTFAVLAAAYSPTFLGAPGVTGLRSWTAFQVWTTRVVEDAARRWHGKCRVVRDGAAWHVEDDDSARGGVEGVAAAAARGAGEARRLIFGYHPHGMYPAAACWFHLTPQFASLFPSVPSPVTLGASVIFCVPLLRDVVMWAGARTVSKGVFRAALRERGAVVLCPGGQAELVEHVGGDLDHEVTLCTRHHGFIRMAIEEGAHLVPVFVFGESQAMRNLIQWKAAQRWTYKRLGFPFPFLPGGFKGFLPLPAPMPLSFVVGEPLAVPPPGADGRAAEEDVVRLCAEYYRRIEDLFHRYKHSSGFPHLRLVLKHD